MKHFQIFSTLLFAMLVASCHQGSETSLNDTVSTDAWIAPSVGTTYVFESMEPGNPSGLDTLTVTGTSQHIGGKTNVVILVEHFVGNVDTEFYNIETNGDFSFGNDKKIDSLGSPVFTWETYPTGSRQTTNVDPPSIRSSTGNILFSRMSKHLSVSKILLPPQENSLHCTSGRLLSIPLARPMTLRQTICGLLHPFGFTSKILSIIWKMDSPMLKAERILSNTFHIENPLI